MEAYYTELTLESPTEKALFSVPEKNKIEVSDCSEIGKQHKKCRVGYPAKIIGPAV